jgi:cell division protein FtsI (penicillin-binding protein 3)
MADALAYLRVPPDDDPWEGRRNELKAAAEKPGGARTKQAAQPDSRDSDDAPAILVTTPGQVPDLRGKKARDAVAALVVRGYRARIDGTGVVIRQTPAAGTTLASTETCTLHLGDPSQLLEDERRLRGNVAGDAPPSVLVAARAAPATGRHARTRR